MSEVMAARMGPKPAAVVGRVTASWSKRLQAAHVEGASTVRLLLEWGVTLRGGGKHAVFLRAAQAGGVAAPPPHASPLAVAMRAPRVRCAHGSRARGG